MKMENKKRLIYLEDAIALLEKDIAENKDALKTAYPGEKTEIRGEMNGVRAAIHILKHHASHGGTVDAVEVVRCKYCIHSFWDEENEMWKCVESAEYDSNYGDYIGWVHYHNADYYCADGERKDNE